MEHLPIDIVKDIYSRNDKSLVQSLFLTKRTQAYKEEIYKMICDDWINIDFGTYHIDYYQYQINKNDIARFNLYFEQYLRWDFDDS